MDSEACRLWIENYLLCSYIHEEALASEYPVFVFYLQLSPACIILRSISVMFSAPSSLFNPAKYKELLVCLTVRTPTLND